MNPPDTLCSLHPRADRTTCNRCGDPCCTQCSLGRDARQTCLRCSDAAARHADPGARLAAYLYNQLLVTLPTVLGLVVSARVDDNSIRVLILGSLAAWVVMILAVNLRLLRRHSQTIGKVWTGVRILRADGQRPSLARLVLLRELLTLVVGSIPVVGTIFGVLDVLVIALPARLALHDMIADTIVVEVAPGSVVQKLRS